MSVIAILSLLLLALGLTAKSALDRYSRSQLEKLCQRRGSELAGKIFARDDQAALAVRALSWIAAAFFVVTCWLGASEAAPIALRGWKEAALLAVIGLGVAVFDLLICGPLGRLVAVPLLFWTWPILEALRLAFAPVWWAEGRIDGLLRRMSGDADGQRASPIQEEILSVVNEGEREGSIDQDAADMIEGLMEMHEVAVSEVMTPRTDMVMLESTATIEKARRTIGKHGHSRIPVYGANRDEVRGILYAKDLLPHLHTAGDVPADLGSLSLRSPAYVPESKPLNVLLREFQRERVHIAIVLDEYGGVAGLVTIEDILEEIVGEIDDEYDPAHDESSIERIDQRTIEADARVHVDEINALVSVGLPEDADYDTIGGFVFSTLGRIPKNGETFEHGSAVFTVLDASDRTINRIRIEGRIEDTTVESPEPTN